MANIDLSKLPPALQSALFAAAKQQGTQPTTNMGEANAPTVQDPQAQQGLDPGLSQFLQGTGHLPADEPAPVMGDQPAGPQAPQGIDLATGPKLIQGANGMLRAPMPRNSLFGLLGLTQPVQAGPNYYQAAKDAGLLKYSPGGMAQMPDGTPFIGSDSYQRMLESQRILQGQGKEIYTTPDQLTAQGLSDDQARKLLAANPKGVTSKEVGNLMGSERITASQQIAEAKSTMAGVAKLGQLLKVGGFDAAQPAAQAAVKNLGNADRAQAAIDQIVANGGVADQRQRAELAAAIAQIASNSSGVLTNERMDQFLPQSAKGKFGNVLEYWTNEREPIDFTGFLPQLQDLLTRERQANKGIADGAASLGIDIMGNSQPKTAAMLQKVRSKNSLVGNPQPAPTAPATPASVPTATPGPHFQSLDDVKAAYKAGKLTLDQAKALAKAMHKAGS